MGSSSLGASSLGASSLGAILEDASPVASRDSPDSDTKRFSSSQSEPIGQLRKPKQDPTAGIITTESQADLARSHFEYPSARNLVLMQIVMSIGYCAYMFTSWSYCAIQRKTLFPVCSSVWQGMPDAAWGCISASLIFWTFPLICCIVFLLYMYRDLLHTRLYYEMLSHRVHLDFMNLNFFHATMVQVMLVWMFLCLLMYPMTYSFSLKHVLVTLPFWIPVLSFGMMFYTQWDLETRLLSISKFVEDDVEWANQHMLRSYFLRDFVAETALEKVIRTLETRHNPPKLTMGEFIHMIADEAERLHMTDQVPDEVEARKNLVNSVGAAWWSPRYWVRLIVYHQSEFLVDEEAAEFRWWFRLYHFVTLLLIMFFIVLCFMTVVVHLHQQGVLPSSILTEWVNLDYLLIDTTTAKVHAKAVATTITTGGSQYMRDLHRIGEGLGRKVSAKLLPSLPEHASTYAPTSAYGMATKDVAPQNTHHHIIKKAANGPRLDRKHVGWTSAHASRRSIDEHSKGRKQKKHLVNGILN